MPPRTSLAPPPTRRRRVLRGAALLTLLASLVAPGLAVSATATPAAPPVAVGGPAGRDYATDHFADPWDYSNSTDILTDGGGPALGASAIGVSGGTLNVHFASSGYVSPVWGGYPGSVLLDRDGGRPGNELQTSAYRTIVIQAYSSATAAAGVMWFNCPGGGVASSCGGGSSFLLQPGWHTYVITPGASRYAGWNLPWGGSMNGLRLAAPGGIDLKVDWMRLVQPGTGTTVGWTNPSGGTGSVQWRSVSSPQPGSGVLGTVSGTSGTLNLSELPAGTYQVGVANSAGTVADWRQVTLTVPLPTITTPNEAGDRDYATQVLGNPWDFHSSADVAGTGNATGVSYAGGMLSATNTTNDPFVMMRIGAGGIDGSTYRHLSVSSGYSGPFDLRDVSGGGTMGRVQWQRTDRGWGQSNDLLTYSGSRTILADLGGPPSTILEPDVPAVPYSSPARVSLFRWDPNEDRGARHWTVRNISLRSDFRTTGEFVVNWADAAYAPGGVATLVADTDRSGCNGTAVATNTPVAPGTNRTVWSTRGLPWGSYWLCLRITRAGASTSAYARGAVVVGLNPPAPDQNPTASWDVASVSQTADGVRFNASGWAFDPSAPQDEARVDLYDHRPDGTTAGVRLPTGGVRPDVATLYPGTRVGTGFSTQLTPTAGRHTYCAYALNVGAGATRSLGCRVVDVPGPRGSFDNVSVSAGRVSVSGWAVDPAAPHSPMAVHVYVNGPGGTHTLTGILTGQARTDVARVYPWAGPATGFSGTVPAAGRGASTVCVYAMAVRQPGANPQLGCRAVTVP